MVQRQDTETYLFGLSSPSIRGRIISFPCRSVYATNRRLFEGMGRRVESKDTAYYVFYGYLGTETLGETGTFGPDNDYVYADGLRIAMVNNAGSNNPTIIYYHPDAIGNTRLVSSANGSIIFSDNYRPYGHDNSSTGTQTYKFTGKPYSPSIGLYYYYQRWYDPSIGRFISPDSKPGQLSSPETLNRYIYVLDSPADLADPSGLSATGSGLGTCIIDYCRYHNIYEEIGGASSDPLHLQGLIYKWNTDAKFRTIVISVIVLVVVGVATAGAGDAFVAPVLIGGVAGGGFSGDFYLLGCSHSTEGCSAEGFGASFLSGAALGAAGGLVGPEAGATGSVLGGGEAATLLSRTIAGGASAATAYLTDTAEGKDNRSTTLDVIIAGGSGFASGGDTVQNPSSFGDAATQITSQYGRNGVLEDLSSSAVSGLAEFVSLLGL